MFRLVAGIFMGLILASNSFILDAAMFGSIGVLAVSLIVYHFGTSKHASACKLKSSMY